MDSVISIDQMNEILDQIAESLPSEFYRELNGGIRLLPEAKYHQASVADDLYTLGEYSISGMGRYITIYYGSFIKIYSYLSVDAMREKLRETMIHEFTHHLESLAGERGLEEEDERQIREYKKRHGLG